MRRFLVFFRLSCSVPPFLPFLHFLLSPFIPSTSFTLPVSSFSLCVPSLPPVTSLKPYLSSTPLSLHYHVAPSIPPPPHVMLETICWSRRVTFLFRVMNTKKSLLFLPIPPSSLHGKGQVGPGLVSPHSNPHNPFYYLAHLIPILTST